MKKAMEHARSGKGPYLVEATVYRYQGHYCGDPAVYRPKEYMEHALENDGIMKLASVCWLWAPPRRSWTRSPQRRMPR